MAGKSTIRRRPRAAKTDETADMFLNAGIRRSVRDFTEQAYLDYAMAVILDRALPHVTDGLKPVQRRIIYAMSELGLSPDAKPKKSVRTVGDVVGKYHPHGDSACYEAMVLMAQDFSYRYPLINGQGNWGSIDNPKSFAAMRYTEARLRPYTRLFLDELGSGTVDWLPNFDNTMREPVRLPAQVPNILLNGGTGIAVGMATDIPPHNLREVLNACIYLLDHKKATLPDLMKFIKGPDFPSGGVITTPPEELIGIYETGSGLVRQRASWHKEKDTIVVTALPMMATINRVQEQLEVERQAHKQIGPMRDESDHKQPVRLVLPLPARVDADTLMSHLFATTDLERSHRVKLNIIGMNGRPRVMNLLSLLTEWISFRVETVRRRLQHRQHVVEERLRLYHIMRRVYKDLEEVIRIIRVEDDPAAALCERLRIEPSEAEAILSMRLRRLAKLEEARILRDIAELEQERDVLIKQLTSEQRLHTLIKKEWREIIKKHGDDRRSELRAAVVSTRTLVAPAPLAEDVTIALTRHGWLKAQRGHESSPAEWDYRQEDGLRQSVRCRSDQPLVLLDTVGRCYSLLADRVPVSKRTGIPITSVLAPPDGTEFCGCLAGAASCLLLTDDGYGFVANLADMVTRIRSGREILRCTPPTTALSPVRLPEDKKAQVVVVGSQGHMLVFAAGELPVKKRGRGLKCLQLGKGETVCAMTVLSPDDGLYLQCGGRRLLLSPADRKAYIGGRGRRGRLLAKGYRHVRAIWPASADHHIF